MKDFKCSYFSFVYNLISLSTSYSIPIFPFPPASCIINHSSSVNFSPALFHDLLCRLQVGVEDNHSLLDKKRLGIVNNTIGWIYRR
jgi:hypothetical protein